MPLDDTQIRDTIETAMHVSLPAIPGISEHFDIPGIKGRLTQVPHPLTNMIVQGTLSESAADNAIAAVCVAADQANAPISWLIGPSSTPSDLAQRLGKHGFMPFGSGMAGMVLRDMSPEIPQEEGISVREIDADDADAFIALAAAGFDIPKEAAAFFWQAAHAPGAWRSRSYLAYADGNPDPIGFASGAYAPHAPLLMLSGAATHPDCRGKGGYRALLARRLADARAEGVEAAIIQAVRATSAPICARIGFTEMCALEMYVRMPPATDATA